MSSMSPEDEEVTILETREASPSNFLLKVESFSLLEKHGIHKYESGEFNAGGHKWRLILYPNEDKDKDCISVYLAISNITSEVNATFSFFVLNQILCNYHYSPGRTRRFMAVKSEWGIPKFISKKVLNDPSNGFLINDKCVFGVEVFIVGLGQDKKRHPYPSFYKRLLDLRKGCFGVSQHVKDQTNDQTNDKTEATILETREASPTHFVMKVKSFSFLGKHGIFNYQSGEFCAGGYKWRLTICENEDKIIGPESKYISAYLAIADTNGQPANWEVNAVFSIFVFSQSSMKYHYSLGRTRRFLAMKPEWGISDFISKKALMDPSNGFLIDNKCVFGAEVFIARKSAVSECLSVKNETTPYKFNWKIFKLGDNWTSEKFVVGGAQWEINMRHNGKNHENGIGIFLYLIDSKRVKATFSICIKDQINNKDKKFEDSNWFSPNSNSWGWPRFMELSTLEDPNNGFIVKDCFHLALELSLQAVV